MSEGPQFSKACSGGSDAQLDILFVHGLTGDPVETWTSGDEFWPKWLCEDLGGVSVYALGYPSSIFEKWAKKNMDLHERAGNLLEHLAAAGIGARPIAIVCHSLGGILVKEMLRASKECADDGWKRVADQTRLVVFMATPHQGASVASAVKLVAPRLASNFVHLLTNDSGYLKSLNQSYRDLANGTGLATVAYYEKFKTKIAGIIVSADSADPGVGSTRPIAVDADHYSICKPAARTDLIYTSLCRHLRTALKACPMPTYEEAIATSFALDDYRASSASDRRDLLQKLMDAGREHEYQKANDLQNKFAQRYYKLGLHTEAKSRSDAILSAVEQRFTVHVYGGKICRSASDDEVAEALQHHVIDAMCTGYGKDNLSPTAILQALYFLTEQCYIRWDA